MTCLFAARAAAIVSARVTSSGDACSPKRSTSPFCMSITSNASVVMSTFWHYGAVFGRRRTQAPPASSLLLHLLLLLAHPGEKKVAVTP